MAVGGKTGISIGATVVDNIDYLVKECDKIGEIPLQTRLLHFKPSTMKRAQP